MSEKHPRPHMALEAWNDLFLWTSVIFAVLAALSTGAAIFTGHAIDLKKDTEIATLKARHITKDQREELISLLTPVAKPKTQIFFNPLMASGEAIQFSEEIKEILTTSGFKTANVAFDDALFGFGGVGAFLQFKDKNSPPQAAKLIHEAFHRVGINLWGLPQPDFTDPERLVIIVGTHP
jgi:hypothetical protein